MHEINNLIVHDGTVVLQHLPYADGQHIKVVVTQENEPGEKKRTIAEVRELLRGSVQHFEDPFEPMIPIEDWEMLK